jgi:hypothetical protein
MEEKQESKPTAPGYVREPKDVPSGDEQLKVKQAALREKKKAKAESNGRK